MKAAPFGLVLGISFLLSPFAARAEPSPLAARVTALAPGVEAKVIAWRRDFHQHPELGNREQRTAAKVAEHLRALGYEVETGVAKTGVVGLLRGARPGPVIALRADMDALPVTERVDLPFASKARAVHNGQEVGVMHACGHDAHTAILMGVAEVLAAVRADLPGTVKLLFQPAEEGPPQGEEGGAELMVEEGVLADPEVEAALALHMDAMRVVGEVGYRPGGVWASSDDFRIVVRGRSSHGASPWLGVDPVFVSAQIVTALQGIVSRQVPLIESPAVVTVGSIHGGNRSNIVPEQVEMVGTIRALEPKLRDRIVASVRQISTQVAAAFGAQAEVTIPLSISYPVTVNDPALTARLLPTLERVAGKDKVILVPADTGAEDFSFFANQVPGFYFTLGARPAATPIEKAADHHTPDFYLDESGFVLGVEAMAALAVELLEGGVGTP